MMKCCTAFRDEYLAQGSHPRMGIAERFVRTPTCLACVREAILFPSLHRVDRP